MNDLSDAAQAIEDRLTALETAQTVDVAEL